MADKEHHNLAEKIREVFGKLEYPGDDNIVYDTNSNYDELVETARAFKGKHWKEITLETLLENFERMPFFSDTASQFYLPVYMIATLLNYDEVGLLAWNTLHFLTPYKNEIDKLERIKAMTNSDQRAVIREFLQAYAEIDPDFYEYSSDEAKLDKLLAFWR